MFVPLAFVRNRTLSCRRLFVFFDTNARPGAALQRVYQQTAGRDLARLLWLALAPESHGARTNSIESQIESAQRMGHFLCARCFIFACGAPEVRRKRSMCAQVLRACAQRAQPAG